MLASPMAQTIGHRLAPGPPRTRAHCAPCAGGQRLSSSNFGRIDVERPAQQRGALSFASSVTPRRGKPATPRGSATRPGAERGAGRRAAHRGGAGERRIRPPRESGAAASAALQESEGLGASRKSARSSARCEKAASAQRAAPRGRARRTPRTLRDEALEERMLVIRRLDQDLAGPVAAAARPATSRSCCARRSLARNPHRRAPDPRPAR